VRWVAIFEDNPQMLEVRLKHEVAHLKYLEEHKDEVVLAGGLREVAVGPHVGGLWVLEVASRERAVELVEQDPYFVVGARSYELRVWGKAFPGRKVLL
jgi:uncharacterized protein